MLKKEKIPKYLNKANIIQKVFGSIIRIYTATKFVLSARNDTKFSIEIIPKSSMKKNPALRYCAQLELQTLAIRLRTDEGIELKDIRQTPHYQLTIDLKNRSIPQDITQHPYFQYIQRHFPNDDGHQMFSEKMEVIQTLLNIEQTELRIEIFASRQDHLTSYRYQIHDGAHRAAVCSVRDIHRVKCYLIGYEP